MSKLYDDHTISFTLYYLLYTKTTFKVDTYLLDSDNKVHVQPAAITLLLSIFNVHAKIL